jgi:hypothetical protein
VQVYYVYRITCYHPDSDQKYYYGFRKTNKNPNDDIYWSSSKYVKHAIDEFGVEYFSKKIIGIYKIREAAIEKEILLHEKFQVDKNPLFFNRAKQSKFGYNCTGDILKGKTYEELYGKERANEMKRHRSIAMKKHRAISSIAGNQNPNYGNKWTDDQKQKLSEQRQGNKHPAYGWFWVNNNVESIKLPPGSDIPIGYTKGRIRTWKNQHGK